MSSPAWWRSTRPTWEVPGATGAWQSVFRARSGAVEPLSKLSLGSCVEVAWCGRKWYLTWKPRRCCRSCTNACNVAPSSARTPLPATRASQRGATSTGLWTTARRSAIGKGATSTAWRASGVILSGVWQPKGESAENGCPSILLSMSGATIIGVCWDQNRLRHCSSCFKANPVGKTGLYPKLLTVYSYQQRSGARVISIMVISPLGYAFQGSARGVRRPNDQHGRGPRPH